MTNLVNKRDKLSHKEIWPVYKSKIRELQLHADIWTSWNEFVSILLSVGGVWREKLQIT